MKKRLKFFLISLIICGYITYFPFFKIAKADLPNPERLKFYRNIEALLVRSYFSEEFVKHAHHPDQDLAIQGTDIRNLIKEFTKEIRTEYGLKILNIDYEFVSPPSDELNLEFNFLIQDAPDIPEKKIIIISLAEKKRMLGNPGQYFAPPPKAHFPRILIMKDKEQTLLELRKILKDMIWEAVYPAACMKNQLEDYPRCDTEKLNKERH